VPTLLGTQTRQTRHEYLYWEYGQAQAVRLGNWFARHDPGKATELYDIVRDPRQACDLAEQAPDTVKRIEKIFAECHTPSEVWPSPNETLEEYTTRLRRSGLGPWPVNING